MIKSIGKISLAGILAAVIVGLSLSASAQDQTKPAPAAPGAAATPPKAKAIPFRGKLVSVDKNAKTITVGKRTFEITSETKLFKGDKPATLDDAVADERVTGTYEKADGGKLEAKSVYFGGKGGEKPADAGAPAK
jgi:hypothetical protein